MRKRSFAWFGGVREARDDTLTDFVHPRSTFGARHDLCGPPRLESTKIIPAEGVRGILNLRPHLSQCVVTLPCARKPSVKGAQCRSRLFLSHEGRDLAQSLRSRFSCCLRGSRPMV